MNRISTLIAIAGAAACAHAGIIESFELGLGALDEGAQAEQGGVGSAPFFMNAQGNDDNFQEYYVMRFDLSSFSGAAVQSVSIDLTHSEAFFSSTGMVELSYSTDDAFDLSTLFADAGDIGGNTQLAASQVALFDFVAGNDGVTDTITLNDVNGLFADIQSGGVITLVLEAAEPGTSATYAGLGNNTYGGPVLNVTVPTPGSIALVGLGGLAAARRRRA